MDITNAELFKEWGNNPSLTPEKISNKTKVWWNGSCGHSWEATIGSRFYNKTGCPYCSNLKLLSGFNDLATKFPIIAAQWHPTKNGTLLPANVSPNSSENIWWLCENNHEWESQIRGRVKNSDGVCLKCYHSVSEITDSLGSTNPELISYWSPGNSSTIFEVKKHSGVQVSWNCPTCEDTWAASPQMMNGKGRSFPCLSCKEKKDTKIKHEAQIVILDKAKIRWSDKNISAQPFVLEDNHQIINWWLCEKNHQFQSSYIRLSQRKIACLECGRHAYTSEAEREVRNFLQELGVENVHSNIKLKSLKGKELDIYAPNEKIAVEFNGLYWHSENMGKPKTYHYDKWLACKEQGIQLIQIWEDDWKAKKDVVKQMLAHKFNKSFQLTIYARKTKVVKLTKKEAIAFFNKNHIQGFSSGSILLGLEDENSTLVASLIIRKDSDKTFNIIRYATSQQVTGGYTKLLSYVEKNYQPNKVVTFSDNCVSDGGLYQQNGFSIVKQLKPDYMYIIKNVRQHKFGYRLTKFKTDPTLLYIEGLTEAKLAELNNLSRIWDAGKIKWEKSYTNPVEKL